MSSDPRSEADAYLKKHKVLPLFHSMGTSLAYAKPSNPNEFLLNYLEDLQKNGGPSKSRFFTPEDLKVMFSMFDPTSCGTITKDQYSVALSSLGIEKQSVIVESDGRDRITIDAFMAGVEAEFVKRG